MSQEALNLWTPLKENPNHEYNILFNEKCKLLIAVPPRLLSQLEAEDKIYKYIFYDNKWLGYEIQQIKTTNSWRSTNPQSNNKNKIYLFDNDKIVMFELMNERKKCKLIIKNLNKIYKLKGCAASIMIKDELHCIADKHFKYNTNTQISKIVLNSPVPEIENGKSLIQVKDKLMLFGGCMQYRHIYEYDVKINCWRCLPVKLPIGVWVNSCAMMLSDPIVLIFATDYTKSSPRNNIYIYEIKTQVIKKSNIKCPELDNQIFVINDHKTACGWIRIQCENLNLQPWPEYLMLLVNRYLMYEVLHTINTSCAHYKLDLRQILNH